MESKKKHNIFFDCLFILFIIFVGLNISGANGYYEEKTYNKTAITAENIKKFEQDVKENKEVDIYDYINKDKTDYRGFASNMGDNFSGFISKMATEELIKASKVLKKMFS